MKQAKMRLSVGILVVVAVALVATSAALLWSRGPAAAGTETPDSIGADFLSTYGQVRSASFDPEVSQASAESAAASTFLQHMGLPAGVGIEEGVQIRSATGQFSGARGGYGEWDVENLPVWVIVMEDLPISLPCGPYSIDECPFPSPKFSVAVDANTGEVVSTELTGAGSANPKWDPLMTDLADQADASKEGDPAPTPVPAD